MTVDVQQDGRVARRERNQDLVLDAVVQLFQLGESELASTGHDVSTEPTVEDIAAWSGVSTRSIYRYFHHREGLVEAAMWHLVDRTAVELPLELADGPFVGRVSSFIEHRLEVYRRVAPLVRALQHSPVMSSSLPPAAKPVSEWKATTVERHPNGVLGRRLTEVFEREFAALPTGGADGNSDDERRQAIAIIDMATEFESLEYLRRSFDGDYDAMVATLVRLVDQQLARADSHRIGR